MDIPPPKPKQNLGRKRGVKQEKRNFSVATKAKQAARRVIKRQDDKIKKAQELRDQGMDAHKAGDHAKSEKLLNEALALFKS